MKIEWPKYNTPSWRYVEIHCFGPAWSLVECQNVHNNRIEVGIFHKTCSPSYTQFIEHYHGTRIEKEVNTLGTTSTNGQCDKCGKGRAPMKYRKMARFLYTETYEEEEIE